MNEKNDIQKEKEDLLKEFPLLFGLEKKNPFSTPDSYFDDAELNISLRINVLEEKEKGNDFGVPENYFDELENKIKKSIQLEGLKTQSFETPENYFENLESDVRLRLMLDGLKKDVFITPENYFEESAAQIKISARLEELKSENVFAIPQDYFETFEERLRAKMGLEKKEARVISMVSYFRQFKYVAAAAALIGVCLMAYFFMKSNGDIKHNAPIELSKLDKKNIIDNPGEYGIDESAVVDLVNENPELLASLNAEEVSSEAVDEIVNDESIDVNTIVGED